MGRLIGGAILGYVVMFAVVFASFSAAYIAMGTEGAFKPESYDASGLWIALSIGLGLVAAVIGGLTAAAVARSAKGATILAVMVLILGLAMSAPSVMNPPEDPGVRTGDIGNMEAMENAQQPTWMLLLNPFLGAVGALIGGRLKKTS